jgi:DNA-binding GntR family transcriptional regulator
VAGEKLTDLAYQRIEELIVTLRLAPGEAVSEYQLSEQLAIGRTPVREALQRLAREKLVVILPRRGVIVSAINVKEQLRLLEVRREVERLVVRSAARRASASEYAQFATLAALFESSGADNDDVEFLRADRDFNDLCLQAARNDFASGAMSLMNGLSRRFWYQHYEQAADLPQTARLHAAIAQAIARADADGSARALDRLLDNIELFTRATLSPDL